MFSSTSYGMNEAKFKSRVHNYYDYRVFYILILIIILRFLFPIIVIVILIQYIFVILIFIFNILI